MEKIVKNARQTKICAFIVSMIFFGFAALWLILVTTTTLININETPDSFEVEFGTLKQVLEYDESLKSDYVLVSYIRNLKMTVIFGLVAVAFLLVSKINRDIAKEGPFGENFVKTIGKKLIGLVVCAFGIVIYNGVYQSLICEKLNYNLAAVEGGITKSTFIFDFPIIAIVFIALSVISTVVKVLKYGAELQKQADETL